eukprot:c3417_g1_i1.p1 GENE.c3417_g1_i1~~c3417_g1_i1.p1  ORF type:complete len:161 (+),score=37.86 c3417_g1_i1:36-485(+)
MSKAPAPAASEEGQQFADEREVVEHFGRLQDDVRNLYSKIAELEQDMREHDLVLTALSEVEDTRKCYRMIGDVLVERTAATVAPAVQKNRAGILDVVDKLKQQMLVKETEIRDLQKRYNIRIKGPGERNQSAPAGGAASGGSDSRGVLA